MGQTNSFTRFINSRKHIRLYAREYAEEHGLNASEVEKDIIQAKKYNHISFGEYAWTGFYDLTQEQKKTVSTLWSRMEFRKKFTDRRYIGMLMNKYIFSKVFDEFYGRKCVQASDVTEDVLKELAEGTGKVVYKPNCKGMGKGVRILPVTCAEDIKDALDHIRNGGNGIIEEYICQDNVLSELNPSAVSVVRFYSVTSPYGTHLFAPVLTSALHKDIANGCQDALTAVVDIRTGKVLTDAVDQNKMEEYTVHPMTGVAFKGLQLNHWDKTLEMLKRAVPLGKKISNIGWDVAITKDGPVLIEANTIPGFNTAQYAGYGWITDGYGYQPLFDAVNDIPFADDGRYERVVMRLE